MQQMQRSSRGARPPAGPQPGSRSRSASPPLLRGGAGRPRRRGLGALWGALLLLAAYYLLVRQPPGAGRQLLKAGLDASSRASLLAASEMTRQIEAAELHKHTRQEVSAAFAAALAGAGMLPKAAAAGNVGSELQQKAAALIAGLQTAAPTLTCAWDSTLPADPSRHGRLLLAANLKNAEALMPHIILQTLALLVLHPQQAVYLSIYESGSKDATGAWLGVLRLLAMWLPQPAVITTGGDLERAEGQDRIAFLAAVRNAALAPLWQDKPWPADRVVFLNDVYFCAADVVRLLSHESAHLACGMDFDRPRIDQMDPPVQRQLFAEWLARAAHVPQPLGRTLGHWTLLVRRWRQAKSVETTFQATAPLQLYDTWVTRDAAGSYARKLPPYLLDPTGAQRIAAGLPTPVACCWNGVAVLDAAPLRAGLRMRTHQPGECAASECSLLCDDFTRLGLHRFVLDPGVRLAYTLREALSVRAAAPDGSAFVAANVTSWADVAAAPPIDWAAYQPPEKVDCCGLQPGRDTIVFKDDCSPREVIGGTNYTAAAMANAATAA